MSQELSTYPDAFVDRRSYDVSERGPAFERRQFTNSHEGLSPDALELARAIDGYKLNHRRRFITYEEMLSVVKSLGYKRYAPFGVCRWDCVPRRGVRLSSEGQRPGVYRPAPMRHRANGPTHLPADKRLARWADRTFASPSLSQGCALRWINGWAFGPNGALAASCSLLSARLR